MKGSEAQGGKVLELLVALYPQGAHREMKRSEHITKGLEAGPYSSDHTPRSDKISQRGRKKEYTFIFIFSYLKKKQLY